LCNGETALGYGEIIIGKYRESHDCGLKQEVGMFGGSVGYYATRFHNATMGSGHTYRHRVKWVLVI